MKFISLFAGIGGFDVALERLGHENVYANDIDKYCKIVYDRHFKTRLDLRDLRTVSVGEIPDHDILCGGFPCQAFSIAGKRRGFEETRGTLFFEIARIIQAKRPAYLFLENVKGLLSHDMGRTFETIMRTIDELGYESQWQVLNSKDFGVPQNRERVFIVGHRRGQRRPKVFPIGEVNPTSLVQLNQPVHSNDRFYSASGLSPTLNTMQGGNRQPKIITGNPVYINGKREVKYQATEISPTIRATQYKNGDNQPKIAFVVDRGKIIPKRIVNTVDANYWKGIDNHQQRTGVIEGIKIRRLTPTECERLQGFPEGWTEGVSDTQRYKMCGNAVTVNVVYEVAKRAFSF